MGEGGQHLEAEGDGLLDRQRIGPVAVGPPPVLQHLLEAHAVDVLHDDVAVAVVLDEVVDLDDVGVLDLGEEAALGEGDGHGVLVAAVEQPLEDDPTLGHEVVAGEVDPAQSAVGEAADDLVLAGDEGAGASEARNENGAPQAAQNPSVRPGCPSRLRPTGSSHRAQKRRCSATVGSVITAVAGSRAGTGGMSTIPAPRRPCGDVIVPRLGADLASPHAPVRPPR